MWSWTLNLHLVPKSRMVELYLHSIVCVYGIVLNNWSTGNFIFCKMLVMIDYMSNCHLLKDSAPWSYMAHSCVHACNVNNWIYQQDSLQFDEFIVARIDLLAPELPLWGNIKFHLHGELLSRKSLRRRMFLFCSFTARTSVRYLVQKVRQAVYYKDVGT
jgi:hypothetical protein